jgi:1-aminocyclopropane-1-carboxylate deaminase
MTDSLLLPSPLQKIENVITRQFGIRLYVKRDDLIHPEITGNKWRKLKYNIEAAHAQKKKTLLTFGGTFSNHITATAAAGKWLGFKTIGVIRGEAHQPLNNSLRFASDCGMELYYVSREAYKNRDLQAIVQQHPIDGGSLYIIPEGGANEYGMQGCREIVQEINIPFDYICCACGTGTTIAGMVSALLPNQKAIGIAVLRNNRLKEEITERFNLHDVSLKIVEYAFNGYAKTTPELLAFIRKFYHDHDIRLDYVYTAKMLYGLFDLISKGAFARGTTIVAVHTGGVANASVFS